MLFTHQFMHNISSGDSMNKPSGESMDEDSGKLPLPRTVLYPPEKIRLDWPRTSRIGAGLTNLGNTCFLNATLQCLTYTAPLVNYLFADDHVAKCKHKVTTLLK